MLLIKLFTSATVGIFVKLEPLTAGKVAGNLASGIVPDANLLAAIAVMPESGISDKLAPDPLNVVAVTIPAKSTPVSAKVTVPSPLRFSFLLTLISDAFWVHFPPLF